MLGAEETRHRFGYRPPLTRERVADHGAVREACGLLAMELDARLPDGREKSLAITKIEEAMFWGNAALARAPEPDPEATPDEAAAGPRGDA